jgi:uncharacterized membrane protein
MSVTASKFSSGASMARYTTAYVSTLITFLAIDGAWIALVAADLFSRSIGPIMRDAPLLYAAAAFYAVYAAALVFLAVKPAVESRSILEASYRGAVLGIGAYATFDLTNLAIIKGWPMGAAILDMAWGTSASAIASAAGAATALKIHAQDEQ